MSKRRPYTFYDGVTSICPTCYRRVEGKIVFEEGLVFMAKRCPIHGFAKVLLATDIPYFLRCRNTLKPSEMPLRFETPIRWGCPYDCGLCPDHEQHSCLTVLEITDRCNLSCPTCYASSSPTHGRHRSLAEIQKMLDAILAGEGEPDVVQISGGEPTIHPEFFEILDLVRRSPIKHLMLNTNGVRIAGEEGFAERLAAYAPGFELYLQFDSLRREPLLALRGVDLRRVREKALDRLNALNLATTLVVTLQKGLNDGDIGDILDFAVRQRCVRGVTFQPVQVAGRGPGHDPARDRITLTEVRSEIIRQFPAFGEDDLIPVPCNPDYLCMAYALKMPEGLQPLTRFIDPAVLLDESPNTILFEQLGGETRIQTLARGLYSTGAGADESGRRLAQLLCCLPEVDAPGLSYENVFRVIIMRFMDAHDFDVRGIKKSCVHIAHPDGRLIPFETMNLFYRDGADGRLEALRGEVPTRTSP